MRNFYYRLVKNMVSLYMCLVLVLTYRLVCNQFYFDIRELPFSLAESEDELLSHINNFDETVYQKKIQTFKNEKLYFSIPEFSGKLLEILC